jgi:hypothetical protein
MASIGEKVNPHACVLSDCDLPAIATGDYCRGHARMFNKGGIVEPELEAKLARIPTPPPEDDYEERQPRRRRTEPDYDDAPEPRRRPSRPPRHRMRYEDPYEALEELGDAIEGVHGELKRAAALALVRAAAQALHSL